MPLITAFDSVKQRLLASRKAVNARVDR